MTALLMIPGIIPFHEGVPVADYVAAVERHVGGEPVLLRLWADNHRRMARFCAGQLNRWDRARRNREAAAALEARAAAIETSAQQRPPAT